MHSAVDTETRTSWGLASTAPCVGMTVSSSSVRSIDSATSVIFIVLTPRLGRGSARKQCPGVDDLLDTRLPEGRNVLESADCQTQIELSQEGPQIVGQAFCTAVRQGIGIGPPNSDGRRAQR